MILQHGTLPFARTNGSNGGSTAQRKAIQARAISAVKSLRAVPESPVVTRMRQRQQIDSRLAEAMENLRLARYANAAGDDAARDRLWHSAHREMAEAAAELDKLN